MTREDLQQAIARLSTDERARLRAWLDRFEAERRGEAPSASQIPSESQVQRLGRIAGRTFADLRKRLREE